jgi:tetratricopeptide (TPR) repeat protein
LIIPVQGEIGFALVTLGRYTEALPHFDEAYAIATTFHSNHDIGLALVNRAGVLALLGRNDEARALLGEAAPHTQQPNAAKNLMALFHLTFARIALSENNWDEAKSQSQEAVTLAGTTLKGAATESNYLLGLAQVFSGASGAGRASCNRALAMANGSGIPSLQADALLAQAQALLHIGDRAAALSAAQKSQELCARLGKPQYEWVALVVSALASSKSGDDSKMLDYATRAENLLAGLQERWGADNYTSYLKRRDIQFYQEQLDKLHLKP